MTNFPSYLILPFTPIYVKNDPTFSLWLRISTESIQQLTMLNLNISWDIKKVKKKIQHFFATASVEHDTFSSYYSSSFLFLDTSWKFEKLVYRNMENLSSFAKTSFLLLLRMEVNIKKFIWIEIEMRNCTLLDLL